MADIKNINGKNIKDATARNEISNLKNSSHSHSNKTILDTITQEKINSWDGRENVGTPNITIGTVTTLNAGSNATASITGTSPNLVLNLGIPKGDKGETGASGSGTGEGVQISNLAIGTVTTLEPGEEATVEIVKSGSDYILNFAIPKGDKGTKGDKGETGASGSGTGGVGELTSKNLTVSNSQVTLDSTPVQIVSISSNITVNIPTNIQYKRVLLHVECGTLTGVVGAVITFKQGSQTFKIKVANASYSVFTIDIMNDPTKTLIFKSSNKDVDLTQTEINEGVEY